MLEAAHSGKFDQVLQFPAAVENVIRGNEESTDIKERKKATAIFYKRSIHAINIFFGQKLIFGP